MQYLYSKTLREYIDYSRLDSYRLKLAMRKALGGIDVRPLITKIKTLEAMWGGVVGAYDMEWKIRQFVIEVINYALIEKKARYQQGVGG